MIKRIVKSSRKSLTQDVTNTKTPAVVMQNSNSKHKQPDTVNHTTTHTYIHTCARKLSPTYTFNKCKTLKKARDKNKTKGGKEGTASERS